MPRVRGSFFQLSGGSAFPGFSLAGVIEGTRLAVIDLKSALFDVELEASSYHNYADHGKADQPQCCRHGRDTPANCHAMRLT